MSMSFKENIALFGNGHRENISFTLNAGKSITLHFKDDGSDTTTDKYFNLRSEAKKVAITVNKIATITHINNQELKSPRTLGTASVNSFRDGIEWGSIVVRGDIDSTTLEVYAS